MNLNKVFLLGRVASDPETRTTTSGKNVCSFSLATNRVWKDASGQKQEEAQFHKIVLWGKLADTASQYLNKGALVLIEGRIQTRSWEDNNGQKRYTTEVIGEGLQLGPKSAGGVAPTAPNKKPQKEEEEDIPVIDEDEIDVKDIPF